MAITTDNDKLSVMEWDNWFEPGIPLSPGAVFSTADLQQLILGYSGVAWGDPPEPPIETDTVYGAIGGEIYRELIIADEAPTQIRLAAEKVTFDTDVSRGMGNDPRAAAARRAGRASRKR